MGADGFCDAITAVITIVIKTMAIAIVASLFPAFGLPTIIKLRSQDASSEESRTSSEVPQTIPPELRIATAIFLSVPPYDKYWVSALTGQSAVPCSQLIEMELDLAGIFWIGLPDGYEGTSMATPHVAATAALIIASGVLGRHPTPAQITARLRATARKLGGGGDERLYGAGLVDAAAATARGGPGAIVR